MSSFVPTYLYVKEHSITRLRYFGKTTNKDPYKYSGSGVYWTNHYKKHNKDHIKTLWVSELFTDKDLLVEFALLASVHWNIVDSNDWANLKPENGLDGFESSKSSEVQNKRVKDGSHHFLSGETTRKQIENGTHSFLGGDLQRKRVKEGTHHFLKENRIFSGNIAGDSIGAKLKRDQQLLEGTHIFQKGIQKEKSARPIYLEVRSLYKNLGLKIPTNTFMRSDDYLFLIKKELLTINSINTNII